MSSETTILKNIAQIHEKKYGGFHLSTFSDCSASTLQNWIFATTATSFSSDFFKMLSIGPGGSF